MYLFSILNLIQITCHTYHYNFVVRYSNCLALICSFLSQTYVLSLISRLRHNTNAFEYPNTAQVAFTLYASAIKKPTGNGSNIYKTTP